MTHPPLKIALLQTLHRGGPQTAVELAAALPADLASDPYCSAATIATQLYALRAAGLVRVARVEFAGTGLSATYVLTPNGVRTLLQVCPETGRGKA